MNFQQNQALNELKENFKQRTVDTVALHIGCFFITLTATFALGSTVNGGQMVVVAIFFFAIMFTISVAFDAIREAFTKKGYLPSIFPYMFIMILHITQNQTNDATYTLGYVAGCTICFIIADIGISVWKLYQAMRKVKDGIPLDSVSPKEISRLEKEMSLEQDIEILKDKHNIKDIQVFID